MIFLNKKFRILLVLIVPFLSIKTGLAVALEMTAFDVGQGDCTVFGFRGQNSPAKVLLMDAGSSEFSGDKVKQQKKIADTLWTYLSQNTKSLPPSDRGRVLNVIASHGDSDHYNWIRPILESVLKRCLKSHLKFDLNVICGGNKRHYTNSEESVQDGPKKKFTEFLERIKEDYAAQVFFSGDTKIKKLNELIKLAPATCEFLANLSDRDKNTCSLVLKVSYKGSSTLILGDATNKTLKSIKPLISLSTTLLRISHHGAHRDCNDADLFKQTNPDVVVISSGMHMGYCHPSKKTLERLFSVKQNFEEDLDEFHPVHYYDDGGSFALGYKIPVEHGELFYPLGRFMNGYCVACTALPIYNTLSQGSLRFEFEDEGFYRGPFLDPGFSPFQTRHQAIQRTLEDGDSEGNPLDFWALNMKDVGITQETAQDFLDLISTRIVALSLEDNDLEDESTDTIVAFIKAHKSLRELDVKGTNLVGDSIRKIWDRGLYADS